jgi:hypothetical protein
MNDHDVPGVADPRDQQGYVIIATRSIETTRVSFVPSCTAMLAAFSPAFQAKTPSKLV